VNNIRSNLWKMYVYKLLSEFYLIVPIIIPFYKSNQLSTTEIFSVFDALFFIIVEYGSDWYLVLFFVL
jgi:hypothetical protein